MGKETKSNFELECERMNKAGALNGHQLYEMNRLGERIQNGLSCRANNICRRDSESDEGAPEEYFTEGFPCGTDRHDAMEAMMMYLQINGYEVWYAEDGVNVLDDPPLYGPFGTSK